MVDGGAREARVREVDRQRRDDANLARAERAEVTVHAAAAAISRRAFRMTQPSVLGSVA